MCIRDRTGTEPEPLRAKLLDWLIALNQLSASEELDEAQAREMLFDVEQAYTAWFKGLARGA